MIEQQIEKFLKITNLINLQTKQKLSNSQTHFKLILKFFQIFQKFFFRLRFRLLIGGEWLICTSC
jgi:hypothetical protein